MPAAISVFVLLISCCGGRDDHPLCLCPWPVTRAVIGRQRDQCLSPASAPAIPSSTRKKKQQTASRVSLPSRLPAQVLPAISPPPFSPHPPLSSPPSSHRYVARLPPWFLPLLVPAPSSASPEHMRVRTPHNVPYQLRSRPPSSPPAPSATIAGLPYLFEPIVSPRALPLLLDIAVLTPPPV